MDNFSSVKTPTLLKCTEQRTVSVSPSPKKGHGKVAKKGHFLTRDNMSKGHFQRANASKKGTF